MQRQHPFAIRSWRPARLLPWLAAAALAVAAALGGHSPGQAAPAPDVSGKSPGAVGTRPGLDPMKQNDPDAYWVKAREMVDRSVLSMVQQHQDELAKGLKYRKVMEGNPEMKEVALTFDDGPHPQYTLKILDILKQYNAKATFFVVGSMAEKYPDLVKAEIAAGHEVGNHTYHHVNLTRVPDRYVATEIKACGSVLAGITGQAPHTFRPPGGDYNKRVAEIAEALGYTIALWTDDPGDWASPGKKAIETRLMRRVGNGGIILIHDGIQQTIDVLPDVLKVLKGKGYRFVTMDELIQHRRQTTASVEEAAAPKVRVERLTGKRQQVQAAPAPAPALGLTGRGW